MKQEQIKQLREIIREEDLDFIVSFIDDNFINKEERNNYCINLINKTIDESSQNMSVFIQISDKNLYSGMYVHGNILVGENENSFSIKRSLLNNNKIYIIKNNILIEKEINIIQIIEERAIIKGLDNGDEILSEPIKGSYSGMNIRIQNK